VSDLLVSDGTDWDRDRLIGYFNPADVEAILKIKLPSRRCDDFIAWHMEKNGIFSVRSAYNLALQLRHVDSIASTSSSSDEGERKLWQNVWSGQIPPKVKIFTWKLSQDTLPTRKNKHKRRLEDDSICNICGNGIEDSFHAVVQCPQAHALQHSMHEHWTLPDENFFGYSGDDWLLLLLQYMSAEQHDLVRLLFWRAWSVRNNIVHNSGPSSIQSSVHVLLSYWATLMNDQQNSEQDRKGKRLSWVPCENNKQHGNSDGMEPKKHTWIPPKVGWVKINVDGAFVEQTGEAGIGILARDHLGVVCFSAWRVLFHCSSPAEAETRACVEGLRLASQWVQMPVIIESDCSRVVHALKTSKEDKSELAFHIREGKELMQIMQEVEIVQVKCERNSAAHLLAQLARRNTHSAVWLRQVPSCIAQQVVLDYYESP
jgi:ribonuclease HI